MSAYKYQIWILLSFLANFHFLHSQENFDAQAAREYQMHLNEEFADPEKSPLDQKDLKEFQKLNFFDVDEKFIVEAEFVRTPSEAPFRMKTSTDRMPVYVKYGELYFSLNGKNFMLNVYQNQELVKDPEYFDYLFLPFTDLTNGRETYGGGRYLDLRIPESAKVMLDFNRSYNPYCAYSGRYSCPVPPDENALDTEISAGVKAFEKAD